jgi:SAM-dependent methyltransferase
MMRTFVERYSSRARAKRGKQFLSFCQPKDDDKILDLGGGTGEHFAAICCFRKNVTIADHSRRDLSIASAKFGFKTVELDAIDKLPFSDNEFDLIFCSSVIEHVTGPKETINKLTRGDEFEHITQANQINFANEIRRVGKKYFVQTPYRYFLMESHSWLPGIVAIFPRRLQVFTIRLFAKFWPKATSPDWRLLTISEMRELFPDARIIVERSFGLVKSIMAIRATE